ncbi:hypothetical protein [Lactobacillus xylocopicola]|uniref:Bacterial Ig domain-containing protein n=1 Tax=Lactobacillus xylocopicola TaxID=2976676 RepID=A0ABM8BIW1_9LACO|nr:hypothetical protein [Lactobacillus xylocopicola]BDR61252.1 hypothetical protein KIM322_15130 [Lactobacillus xylocopicola]
MKRIRLLFALVGLVILGASFSTGESINAATFVCKLPAVSKPQPKLSKINVNYDQLTKQATVTGTAKGLKRVKLIHNKKRQTVKVNPKGTFKAQVKIKDYPTLTLHGLNHRGKKASPNVKVTAAAYAAPSPLAVKGVRTSTGITYELTTHKGCMLNFYYGNEKVYSTQVESAQSQVTLPATLLEGKSGYFTVRQEQVNKKISPATKAEIPQVGFSFAINK